MGEIEVKIVIPSMGRWDKVKTLNAISNAILCVPESEANRYEVHNPGVEIVSHPDTIKGLTLKRQFIYETIGSCFQIDDDIRSINKLYVEKSENPKLTKDEAYFVIQYVANCARLAGCYLFGISKEPNPLSYNGLNPISRSGVVNGDIGMIASPESKLYFHELSKTTEDYFVSAINAHYHRHCWIDKRFVAIAEKTFANPGGMGAVRTAKQIEDDTLFLRKMFGEAVQLKKDTAIAKRKFEVQPTLKIPF